MSSPAWQFQMGDPDALNAAGFVLASNAVLAAVAFQVRPLPISDLNLQCVGQIAGLVTAFLKSCNQDMYRGPVIYGVKGSVPVLV